VEYARAHGYDRSEGEWVAILMRGFAQRKLRQSMIAAIEHSTVIPAFIKPIALSSLEGSGPLLVAYDRAIRTVVNQTGRQDGQMNKAALQAEVTRELSALGVSATQAQVIGRTAGPCRILRRTEQDRQRKWRSLRSYRSLGQGGIPRSVMEAFLGHAQAAPVTAATLTHPATRTARRRHSYGRRQQTLHRILPSSSTGLVHPAHAYTILDYDAANRTVTLRNPWGSRPSPDGVFQLPLSTFQRMYLMYSYSEAATP